MSGLETDRVEHGDDILRRNIGLDVVDLLEDKSAAGIEDADLFSDMIGNLLGRRLRQDRLGVAAAAPEGDPAAEAGFEAVRRPCVHRKSVPD